MKNKRFEATSLRTTLVILAAVMVAILFVGFYYAQSWLDSYAADINRASAILASKDNIQTQSELRSELARLKPSINKTNALLVPYGSYLATLAPDINKYASATGITITEISPSQLPDGALMSNVIDSQTRYLKITLKNPVPFGNLIKFIKALETNIPKMRLTGITLTHNDSDGGSISVGPIVVEVYTK